VFRSIPGDRWTQVVRVIEYGQEAEHHERRHAAFHGKRTACHHPSVLQHRHFGGRRRPMTRSLSDGGGRRKTTPDGRLLQMMLPRCRRPGRWRSSRTTLQSGRGRRRREDGGGDRRGQRWMWRKTTTHPATAPAWRYAGGARRVHVRRTSVPRRTAVIAAAALLRSTVQRRRVLRTAVHTARIPSWPRPWSTDEDC